MRDKGVPARKLGPDLYPSELDVVAFAGSQTSALNRVDDRSGGGIADDTAGFPVFICASSEVIGIAVEDGVSPNEV